VQHWNYELGWALDWHLRRRRRRSKGEAGEMTEAAAAAAAAAVARRWPVNAV
jgi:hypothetical protein